jgi:uncharacterized membrane protein YjgN (DUF898 family)
MSFGNRKPPSLRLHPPQEARPRAGAAASAPSQNLFVNHANLSDLFKIHLTNLALTIVTLGFYRFWAKTRMRRYLWSHIEIDGDRLEYTGTPMELLFGFLIVLFVFIVPVLVLPRVILVFGFPENLLWNDVVGFVQGVLVLFLIPFAIYRARRYRLSRTAWRGIRGRQTGSALLYAAKSFLFTILNVVTLGLIVPVTRTHLAKYRAERAWIGDEPFRFGASAGRLYGAWFGTIGLFILAYVMLILAVLVPLGIMIASKVDLEKVAKDPEQIQAAVGDMTGLSIAVWVIAFLLFQIPRNWYAGSEYRYFATTLRFQDLGFEISMSRWAYIWLMLTNTVIVFATLTIATPLAHMRLLNFASRRIVAYGDLRAAEIGQSPEAGPGRGEGLADAFDVGAI